MKNSLLAFLSASAIFCSSCVLASGAVVAESKPMKTKDWVELAMRNGEAITAD